MPMACSPRRTTPVASHFRAPAWTSRRGARRICGCTKGRDSAVTVANITGMKSVKPAAGAPICTTMSAAAKLSAAIKAQASVGSGREAGRDGPRCSRTMPAMVKTTASHKSGSGRLPGMSKLSNATNTTLAASAGVAMDTSPLCSERKVPTWPRKKRKPDNKASGALPRFHPDDPASSSGANKRPSIRLL